MTDMTPNAQEGQSGNSPSETNDKDKEIAMLKDQLWQAKKDLEYQRMRADVFDRMIDLAEDRWKINIRKNLVPNSEKPGRTG